MSQERSDFQGTPAYDDFLELREDLIAQFIQLYDVTGNANVGAVVVTREELEKTLHKFEVENQERIIHSRSTADERKRRRIEGIIEAEGVLYERMNVDYKERDSVIDHELAFQHADLLARSKNNAGDERFNQHASADLLNRKTRLIQQPPVSHVVAVPVIVEASGCKGLWMKRAEDIIFKSFKVA